MKATVVTLTLVVLLGCVPPLPSRTLSWPSSTLPFTTPTLTKINNDKCTTTPPGVPTEVGIRSVRVLATCSNGVCASDFWWALQTPVSGCDYTGTFDVSTAKAYVTGWRVATHNQIASQIQAFRVWVDSLAPTVVGGQLGLPFRVGFVELNQGSPGPISQDSNDVEVTIEIITISKGSKLRLTTWVQSGTSPGGIVSTSHSGAGPEPLQFAALSGFELATSIAGGPSGAALGTNIGHFGIDTDVTPLASGGFSTDVHCYMESDSPAAPASQLSSCRVAFVALVGSSPNVVRAPSQPSGLLAAPLPLDNSVPTVPFHVGGSSGVTGWPSCGLKSFAFSVAATPFTTGTGVATTARTFKQRSLGYLLGDCDPQLFTAGQSAQATVKGWFVWDNAAGASDQHAGVFSPPPFHPQFEFHSWDFQHIDILWSGLFELDSVALK